MTLSSQNLTRGARVNPDELYRVTIWTDIACPAPITGAVSQAQRCINARGAHGRVVQDLASNQLKPDGIFAIPTTARMEGEPQLLGVIGGTRMVSTVIGNPVRNWSFDELRGQVSFLGRGEIDNLTLENSDTTGSALSDAANAVEDTVDNAAEELAELGKKIQEAGASLPSLRTVVLIGAAAGGLLITSKVVRAFT